MSRGRADFEPDLERLRRVLAVAVAKKLAKRRARAIVARLQERGVELSDILLVPLYRARRGRHVVREQGGGGRRRLSSRLTEYDRGWLRRQGIRP